MNSEWTIDVYSRVGGKTLLDLALLTAEWAQRMASGLDARLALRIDLSETAHNPLFAFTAEAPLP